MTQNKNQTKIKNVQPFVVHLGCYLRAYVFQIKKILRFELNIIPLYLKPDVFAIKVTRKILYPANRLFRLLNLSGSCMVRWVVLGVSHHTLERDDVASHSNQHGDREALARLLIS